MSDIPSASLGLEPKQHEWCREDKGTFKKQTLMYCLIAGTVPPDPSGFRLSNSFCCCSFFFFVVYLNVLCKIPEKN